MAIKYREDPDLNFLMSCENDDLNTLATYLIKDKDGKSRFSEELSNDPTYKYCNGNYQKAWQQIAGELQLFGGDTLANTIRGHGVLYKDILCDVCDKLKVNYNRKQETSQIESYLLQKIISDSWEKMEESERKELLNSIGVDGNLVGAAALGGVIGAIKLGGFAAYKTSALIANAIAKLVIGKGLKFAANAALMRGIAVLAGPIGIAIGALMALPSITGVAYRVTIPCVIHIAYMRQKLINKERF